MLNPARLQALAKWQQHHKIKLSQVNGQRKYGGPPEAWEGPVPGDGCEVFINGVPRETYEDRLIPLFFGVGPLWEFRLMMNFSGMNRGFAYAKYGTSALAAAAVSQLHGHELEPGVYLSVRHSTEKSQLCVGQLPASTQWADLMQVLMCLSQGVEGLSLKAGRDIEGKSALVTYVSHHAASMAKKVLEEGFRRRFSLRVSVKWQSCQLKFSRPLAVGAGALPPRFRHRRSPAETFNKAPRAPVSLVPPPPSSSIGMPPVAEKPKSAFSLLQWMCGTPAMRLEFGSIQGGRFSVTYEVRLPVLTLPFDGVLTASVEGTLGELHDLVAERVLADLDEFAG